MAINRTIEDESIEYTYMSPIENGKKLTEPKEVREFVEEQALALMLANEVIFLNDHQWEKEWPETARKTTSLNVGCNDVFAWGCADAEELPYREIENLYKLWRKEPYWGAAMWCMIQRKQMPQRPVEKYIRATGIWDLDAFQKEHGLNANYYDGISGVLADKKYDAYKAWAGAKALPFDAKWWDGWKEYTAAHPDWHSPEWKADEERLMKEWRNANGHSQD